MTYIVAGTVLAVECSTPAAATRQCQAQTTGSAALAHATLAGCVICSSHWLCYYPLLPRGFCQHSTPVLVQMLICVCMRVGVHTRLPCVASAALYDASFLENFQAGYNGMSGSLPDWANSTTANTTLQQLHLQGNSLQGPIPASYSQLQQLTCLRLDNNPGLCGVIPENLPCFDIRSTGLGEWLWLACATATTAG